MKTERNIIIAFILNLSFSIVEFVGGILTGSVAIVSDAVHDVGDAASIGVSYVLERKSKKQPDENYTYGYARYSVIGGCITTLILLIGSVAMICKAVGRILAPAPIEYNGMLLFAVVGVCVNACAALFTREGDSLNQKAVNLHMLEDVLGWVVVLVGALVMRFTECLWIDPMMSIGVSLFILIHAIKNLKETVDLFLEKTPRGVSIAQIKEHLEAIDGVLDVHHIHLWSMDGQNHVASMHIVADSEPHKIKDTVRSALREHGIGHVTIETETSAEQCRETHCHMEIASPSGYAHHAH